jgi:hypothetical protein
METEGSLPCPQEPATGPGSDESSAQSLVLFPKDTF